MKITVFIFLFFASVSAAAHPLAYGPTSLGLANTGRAGLESPESIFLNPALVGMLNKSGAQFVYLDGKPTDATHQSEWGVTLVDSESDLVSHGALSYRSTRRVGFGPPANGDLWHMGFGKLLTPRFAFGVSGYWLKYRSPGLEIPDQWNGSLGLLYLITPNLGLAYVLDSPFRQSGALPASLREALTHSAGVFYKLNEISRFRLDLTRQEDLNPDKKLELGTSLEVMTSDFFVFRLGNRWNWREDYSALGVGLGFAGPRLKVTYGFQKTWEGQGTLHSVDLRIPL